MLLSNHPIVLILKSRRFPSSYSGATDGGAILAYRQASRLADEGCLVHIITRGTFASTTYVRPNMVIRKVPFRSSNQQNPALRDLEEGASFVKSAIDNYSALLSESDIVFTHHWTSAVGLEAIVSPDKWIHMPHLLASEKARFDSRYANKYIFEAERLIIESCTSLICVSDKESKEVSMHYGSLSKCIHVAPPNPSTLFVDAGRRRRLSLLTNEVAPCRGVISIGRWSIQKQIGTQIGILKNVANIIKSPVQFCSVAPPYEEAGNAEMLRNSILASVSHRSLPRLMQGFGIFLSTSRYESFGLAALEALCAGMVVVSSDIPSLSHCNGVEDGFFCFNTIDEVDSILVGLLSNNAFLSKSQISASKAGARYCQKADLFIEISCGLALSKMPVSRS
jgi:glycosyltransferase involved in cell wall biosynthesis